MNLSRTFAFAGTAVLLLALTACDPGAAGPTPSAPVTSTPAESESPTPTPSSSESTAPTEPAEEVVTAAVVVVTASTLSVFGSDGSTLLAANYRMDGDDVAEDLAVAVGVEPDTAARAAISEACPAQRTYDFDGLVITSPAPLNSNLAYSVDVTAPAIGGVAVETVGGQRVGATLSAFRAAIGDEVLLEDYPRPNTYGFEIVNPEADEWEQVGFYADFTSGELEALRGPLILRFVGGCA